MPYGIIQCYLPQSAEATFAPLSQQSKCRRGVHFSCNIWLFERTRICPPNGISIGSAIFAGLTSGVTTFLEPGWKIRVAPPHFDKRRLRGVEKIGRVRGQWKETGGQEWLVPIPPLFSGRKFGICESRLITSAYAPYVMWNRLFSRRKGQIL